MPQLPLNPNLEHLRNEAKALMKAYRASDDTEVFETIRQIHPRLEGKSNDAIREANLSLGEMQFMVARRYGFSMWAELKHAVEEEARIDWNHATPEQLKERFIRAVSQADPDEVRRLLKKPYIRDNINACWFGYGAPALVSAATQNQQPNWVAIALLDYGANTEAKSHWWAGGSTALQCAAGPLYYNARFAQYLIQRGAKVDPCSAAGLGLGMLDTLRELVAADPNAVHATATDGMTPLHFTRSIEVAEFLLEHGADINARDKDHHGTPAQWAMYWSHKEHSDRRDIARYLVDRGAEADLLLLCALGDRERVEATLAENPALVNQDFKLEAPGGYVYQWGWIGWGGQNALGVAFRYNYPDLFRMLLQKGAQQSAAILQKTAEERDDDYGELHPYHRCHVRLPGGTP